MPKSAARDGAKNARGGKAKPKIKAANKVAKATGDASVKSAQERANVHVTFDEDGQQQAKPVPPPNAAASAAPVVIKNKKRARQDTQAPASSKRDASAKSDGDGNADTEPVDSALQSNGGKSDRSPEAIQDAKYYLEQWKKRGQPLADGDEPWKFKKVKQLWIIRWMFEADVIPKSMFALVLEYLGGMQGAARQRVLQSAHEILDTGVPEKTSDDTDEQDLMARLARRRYKRALQVAEVLS